MNEKLYQAKELLTLLSVNQHSPDVYADIDNKPPGIEGVVAQKYDLPFAVIYVDDDDEELVVGFSLTSVDERKRHESELQEILMDIPFRIKYANVLRDNAPNKQQDCRPLWGGVKMNSDATLSVVYAGAENKPVTILSSHAIGNNGQTGQKVGQAASTAVYGVVTVNPSLEYRASDSALAKITNDRIHGEPNRIWSGPNTAFIVNDYAISSNTPEGLVLYMQGAKTDRLQRGALLRKGVTVTDARGTLTGQILSNYSAQGGDSGAPIFYMTDVSGYVVYIGIHGGRIEWDDGNFYPYYSPWESIRKELNLPQYEINA